MLFVVEVTIFFVQHGDLFALGTSTPLRARLFAPIPTRPGPHAPLHLILYPFAKLHLLLYACITLTHHATAHWRRHCFALIGTTAGVSDPPHHCGGVTRLDVVAVIVHISGALVLQVVLMARVVAGTCLEKIVKTFHKSFFLSPHFPFQTFLQNTDLFLDGRHSPPPTA